MTSLLICQKEEQNNKVLGWEQATTSSIFYYSKQKSLILISWSLHTYSKELEE